MPSALLRTLFIGILATFALSACGNKDDLYLETPPAPAKVKTMANDSASTAEDTAEEKKKSQ